MSDTDERASLAELRAIYAETDALLAPFSCESTTECCQFGITGREPYPTTVELAEMELAIRKSGTSLRGNSSGRSLPIVDAARRCPLLSDDNRCRIYASRPFGCRTFFCHRATGPSKLPRKEIQALSRRIADLSARFAPRDPLPRPLTAALTTLEKRPRRRR